MSYSKANKSVIFFFFYIIQITSTQQVQVINY